MDVLNVAIEKIDWKSLLTDADVVIALKKMTSQLRLILPLSKYTPEIVAQKMDEHIRSSGFDCTDLRLEVKNNAIGEIGVSYTVSGSFTSARTQQTVTF